ncbi:putative HTH-type transcriptional regulator [Zhongshania aliphaticivorans]|uniref:Putative HTH-type transcriptional regulator n=1 Tax=Zhongshania aliphaticivorans TaxID=1470434 RepID=A0A5S9NJU8_9GAMM|nr:AraC family transcriptional regulator [Zhongshania aliphaticivorans]CAA0089177.1 putative HTH-type transcriptional regulator [Zhongshania aliphaticivorans]CAA0095852.1 putative HTH-type transcriptional regulator [Zhongshania aliphaticivorans]
MRNIHPSHRDRVPLKYARNILLVAEAQGYDCEELLRTLDLPVNPLAPGVDLDGLIGAHHYSQIYRRVMWLLQDESFGLGLDQRTPAGSFRMLCLFIIHCETLEQALERAAEFINFCRSLTATSHNDRFPIQRLGNGTALYRFPDNADLVTANDINTTSTTVAHTMAIWRRFCHWLIGKPLDVIAIHLQADVPERTDYFTDLFACEVQFGCEENAFVLAEFCLDCPLIHTEESLQKFLRNAPFHLLVSQDDDDSSLLSQMKRIVGPDLSHEFPSVVVMAEHLNMSVRTLRRRLNELDTTYQQFKDELRQEHATRWLNQPELKINAVSALLGFDEPSAFHRSFKKWTGMTPGEYRASRQPNIMINKA